MRFPWKIECGIRKPPDVRGEVIGLAKLDRPFRALYMSDLHLREGVTEALCDQLRQIVAMTTPDLLLLGGDLVDRGCGLPQLDALISFARRTCLVGATGGNHDHRVGIGAVQRAVEQAGGVWLDRQSLAFFAGATRVVASGGLVRQAPPTDVSIHWRTTLTPSDETPSRSTTSSLPDTFTAVNGPPLPGEGAFIQGLGSIAETGCDSHGPIP